MIVKLVEKTEFLYSDAEDVMYRQPVLALVFTVDLRPAFFSIPIPWECAFGRRKADFIDQVIEETQHMLEKRYEH